MRAESPFEQVGIGVGFASPIPGVSLLGQFDERWSGIALLRLGEDVRAVDLRANYAPEESNGTYWSFGAGYDNHIAGSGSKLGVLRAGVGRAWRRGAWRWHLEATLNLPVYLELDDEVDGLTRLGDFVVAGSAVFLPIGFGVHYVFGER